MSERPVQTGARLGIKHTTRWSRAILDSVESKLDVETLSQVPADGLELNDIAHVRLRLSAPLLVDPYTVNRTTGAFVLVDEATNDTVAAGMVVAAHPIAPSAARRARRRPARVREHARRSADRTYVLSSPGARHVPGGAVPDGAQPRLRDAVSLVAEPVHGCAHRCTFCYVRAFEARADRDPGESYGRSIRVKVNVGGGAATRARASDPGRARR